jgi:hypothetical protein
MRVYVATIDTRYEVMAVATTAKEARQLVAKQALEYLRQGGHTPEHNSIKAVLDYFEPCVTELEIGTADFTGNPFAKGN